MPVQKATKDANNAGENQLEPWVDTRRLNANKSDIVCKIGPDRIQQHIKSPFHSSNTLDLQPRHQHIPVAL